MTTLSKLGIAAAVLGLCATAQASDHIDGIKTAIDTAADLTDLYTFTSPRDPNRLVLIMNVHPFASSTSMFSDAVNYRFRIRPIDSKATLTPSADPSREQNITCTFAGGGFLDSTQVATCTFNLSNGTSVLSFSTRGSGYQSGGEGSNAGARVFAGVRSDPWFLDLVKTLKYNAGLSVSGAGKNGLAGQNVLSIVVEVDKTWLPGSLLAVTAQTVHQ